MFTSKCSTNHIFGQPMLKIPISLFINTLSTPDNVYLNPDPHQVSPDITRTSTFSAFQSRSRQSRLADAVLPFEAVSMLGFAIVLGPGRCCTMYWSFIWFIWCYHG